MSAAPDVSVIVTSYNIERYIARAIHSALAQEGVTLEVIVADDGSSDGTWEAITAISDPRLKPIRLAGNSGPGAARNAAIAQATGRWLAVLDGDDLFLPGRLARLLNLAQTHQAHIIVDNLEVTREADGVQFPMFPPFRDALLTPQAFIRGNSNFMSGYTLGYLKPVFSAVFLKQHALRYPEHIRIGEDYLMLLEALVKGAVCVMESVAGYGYTARAGSISHRLNLAAVERIQASDAEFFANYVVNDTVREAQHRRAQCLRDAYAYTAMLEALKQCDFAALLKAISYYPLALRHLWRPLWARLQRITSSR